jgi:hypothetical protein
MAIHTVTLAADEPAGESLVLASVSTAMVGSLAGGKYIGTTPVGVGRGAAVGGTYTVGWGVTVGLGDVVGGTVS